MTHPAPEEKPMNAKHYAKKLIKEGRIIISSGLLPGVMAWLRIWEIDSSRYNITHKHQNAIIEEVED